MSSNIQILRLCQSCHNKFTARTTVTKYCGHPCASRAYKARKRGEKIEASNQETAHFVPKGFSELQAKEFLSVAETSRLLGISRWTLTRAISDGRLSAVRFGRRIVIKRTDIDRMFLGLE
jgi:excisionase family DNA binding protein